MTTRGTIQAALADARPVGCWLDRREWPSPLPPLVADTQTDLATRGVLFPAGAGWRKSA